jgi:hypothetical protein
MVVPERVYHSCWPLKYLRGIPCFGTLLLADAGRLPRMMAGFGDISTNQPQMLPSHAGSDIGLKYGTPCATIAPPSWPSTGFTQRYCPRQHHYRFNIAKLLVIASQQNHLKLAKGPYCIHVRLRVELLHLQAKLRLPFKRKCSGW